MDISISLVEGGIIMFAIITLAVFLKKINIVNKDDKLLFSRIVLYVTLPATIFSSLAVTQNNCWPDLVSMAVVVTLAFSVVTVSGLFTFIF